MKKPWLMLFFHSVLVSLLLFVLCTSWYGIPPLGKFLSPQSGFWYNAEPVEQTYNNYTLLSPFHQLEGEISIAVDSRMVPHIFAVSYKEALFAQGYMHARDRLFQMEFATRLAEGSLSEWFGPNTLKMDKKMRHMGLPMSAEKMELEMLRNLFTRELCMSYVAGINFFLSQLNKSSYPVEYKILNAAPAPWSVYKVALAMKYLSFVATKEVDDIPFSQLKKVLDRSTFEQLFPLHSHFLIPAFPMTETYRESFNPPPPIDAQSSYFHFSAKNKFPSSASKKQLRNSPYHINIVDKSPNSVWAIAPQKTSSGDPILCNTLRFNFPSMLTWYELQLHFSSQNIYGVSIPGIPGIVAGFNQHIAWGITNAKRDVLDYYNIKRIDAANNTYQMEGSVFTIQKRIEKYNVKGSGIIYDTVYITDFGPVINSSMLGGTRQHNNDNIPLIVRWTGHLPSNDVQCFLQLNLAKNIVDYHQALQSLKTPGLNIAFASNRHIALIQQGIFPIKWERQGDFIMPLKKAYLWKKSVPYRQQFQLVDPQTNFVSSASQRPTLLPYPYVGSRFPLFEGAAVNKQLKKLKNITVDDMMQLQSNSEDLFAKIAIQNIIGSYVVEEQLSSKEKQYKRMLLEWNFKPTAFISQLQKRMFEVWWSVLEYHIWADELQVICSPTIYPSRETLLENLLFNDDFDFVDNIHTKEKEDIYKTVTDAFVVFCHLIDQYNEKDENWWNAKMHTSLDDIQKLRKGPAEELLQNHRSPLTPKLPSSYRMIIQLGEESKGYVSSSNGQSGNPGSKYYNSEYTNWIEGRYNKIQAAKEIEDVQNNMYIISIMSPKK